MQFGFCLIPGLPLTFQHILASLLLFKHTRISNQLFSSVAYARERHGGHPLHPIFSTVLRVPPSKARYLQLSSKLFMVPIA